MRFVKTGNPYRPGALRRLLVQLLGLERQVFFALSGLPNLGFEDAGA